MQKESANDRRSEMIVKALDNILDDICNEYRRTITKYGEIKIDGDTLKIKFPATQEIYGGACLSGLEEIC